MYFYAMKIESKIIENDCLCQNYIKINVIMIACKTYKTEKCIEQNCKNFKIKTIAYKTYKN